ncbi:MAG: hypothetical protein U5R31_01135 [Acidimicrobiia bacterium]|nr:hypothetical protein [Acidimicrobiia bacterium]
MKRLLVLTATVLMAVFGLVACSSDDDGSASSDDTAVEISEEARAELVEVLHRRDRSARAITDPGLESIAENGDELLDVLDERIERIEAVDVGPAEDEVDELVDDYREHREAAAEVVEQARADDQAGAGQTVQETLGLINEINGQWRDLGAPECVETFELSPSGSSAV